MWQGICLRLEVCCVCEHTSYPDYAIIYNASLLFVGWKTSSNERPGSFWYAFIYLYNSDHILSI